MLSWRDAKFVVSCDASGCDAIERVPVDDDAIAGLRSETEVPLPENWQGRRRQLGERVQDGETVAMHGHEEHFCPIHPASLTRGDLIRLSAALKVAR